MKNLEPYTDIYKQPNECFILFADPTRTGSTRLWEIFIETSNQTTSIDKESYFFKKASSKLQLYKKNLEKNCRILS